MSDTPSTNVLVISALDTAYELAEHARAKKAGKEYFKLDPGMIKSIEAMCDRAGRATTGFTNIVTGLAIKVAHPTIDTRYHQVQIQDPKHFNFRGVSEKAVYPWLRDRDFDGAKSGWQTRTFERPKPYTLDYDENIGAIKEPFLYIYDAMQSNGSAAPALAYLIFLQMKLRDQKTIDLICPGIDDIATITSYFEEHFFHKYKAQGASRLPVLALYALYKVIIPELKRYEGTNLSNLELHSAADSQTGATGDIEIKLDDGNVFEAVEVKHNIKVTEDLIIDSAQKLISRSVNRYYVLTTHKDCSPDDSMIAKIKEIRDRTGCQIIANGVIPTLKYYLRMVDNPASIFQPYVDLLKKDTALTHEHREYWNNVVLGKISSQIT